MNVDLYKIHTKKSSVLWYLSKTETQEQIKGLYKRKAKKNKDMVMNLKTKLSKLNNFNNETIDKNYTSIIKMKSL